MPATIFAIDDEPDNLTFLEAIIAEAGCEAETISDPTTAIDRMRANLPALVFLDVQMPGLNGFQVLRAMRAEPALAEVPVVLLSAIGAVTGVEYDEDLIEQKYGVRPDGFLAKPISPDGVKAELAKVTGDAA
jgi:CheY-like chemotaxis protein